MRIVITGATGFIGRKLTTYLALAGHECILLVRDPLTAQDLPGRCIAWQTEDLAPNASLVDGLRGADALIHLAGESIAGTRWTSQAKERILQSRTRSTRILFNAIAALPENDRPKTWISASAIGYYGDQGQTILTESSSAGSGFLSEVVQAWEKEANSVENLGIRTVILRLGVVLGVGGGALEKMGAITLGGGQQWMSWVHAQDVLRFLEYALTHVDCRGVFNLTAPQPVTQKEFSKTYASLTGAPLTLPAPRIALIAVLGEMSAIVLESCRAIPKRTLESGFSFQYSELGGALREIFPAPHEQRLSVAQFIPYPILEIFPFFSEAKNLEAITPPWLGFKILGTSTPSVEQGTLIDYQIRIHGVPVHWRTRIEDWSPGHHFVDNQLKGPYTKWHHTHRFDSVPGGTLMRDEVIYRLPLGQLGKVLGSSLVKKDVTAIFDYRRRKIAELFPPKHSRSG